jgi:hypothetical protein
MISQNDPAEAINLWDAAEMREESWRWKAKKY